MELIVVKVYVYFLYLFCFYREFVNILNIIDRGNYIYIIYLVWKVDINVDK